MDTCYRSVEEAGRPHAQRAVIAAQRDKHAAHPTRILLENSVQQECKRAAERGLACRATSSRQFWLLLR